MKDQIRFNSANGREYLSADIIQEDEIWRLKVRGGVGKKEMFDPLTLRAFTRGELMKKCYHLAETSHYEMIVNGVKYTQPVKPWHIALFIAVVLVVLLLFSYLEKHQP